MHSALAYFGDTFQSLVDSCNGTVARASKLTGGVSRSYLSFEFRSLNSLLRVALRSHARRALHPLSDAILNRSPDFSGAVA